MRVETNEDRNDVIRALLRDLDRHSEGERNHAERVAVYATATANELGVTGEDLMTIRYGALLHDIGKVRLDGDLLRKVGKLTDDELSDLHRHSELSLDVVASYPFLTATMPILRHHHERWDGTGYPDGLAGDAIPLGARIVAVCEAFDTLVSGSPWQGPAHEEEAIGELLECEGEQFDPNVVDAFLRVQPLIQPVGS